MARFIVIVGTIIALLFAIWQGEISDPFPFIYIALAAALVTWTQPFWAARVSVLHAWLSKPRTVVGLSFRPSTVLLELGIGLGFLAVAAAIFPNQAMGDRPIDHDHPVHFFRAWQLREFLADGRLFGWSHHWFAGNPFEYLYPFGTEALVVSVWAIGLGLWSLDTAYALTFVLFWALQGWSTYYAGKAFIGRWAGLLAGAFALLDTGGYRFGGWVFAGQWGVWPNSLAIAIGMIGIAQIPKIVTTKDRKSMAVFAIFMGLSLLTHPLQLVHLLMICLVSVLAVVTSERQGSRVLGTARLVVSSVIAFCIGSLWLLPFFDTKKYSENYGEPWRNAYDMGSRLYTGNLLEGTWMLVAILAMLGTVALLRDRRFKPSLIALMTFLCMAGASTWFISAFHLPQLSDSLTYLQYQRFAMLLKPYAFIAAGAALVAIFKAATRTSSPSAIRNFLVLLLGAPILFGWVDGLRHDQLTRNFQEKSDAPYLDARRDLAIWLNKDWQSREVPFYRVEIRNSYHDHSFVDFGTEIAMPIYKPGFTPAENFRFKMEGSSTVILDALNIRYVVSTTQLGQPYELIRDFGQGLKLYSYKNWKKDPFVVTGGGQVELISWSDERIVVRADQAASGTLRLNVSEFSRWHATRNGQDLTIQPTALPGQKNTGFMSVPLAPGEYVFEFRKGVPEYAGLLLFLAGMTLCGLLLVSNKRPGGLGALELPLLHLAGVLEDADDTYKNALEIALAIGFVTLLAALIALAAWKPVPSQVKNVTEVRYDLGASLGGANVARGNRSCVSVLGRHLCTPEEWGQVYRTAVEFNGKLRNCIWAHPYAKTPLTIEFPNVPAGKVLGWFGVADTGESNRPVDVKWSTGSRILFEGATAKDGQTYPVSFSMVEAAPLTVEINTANQGTRHFCFDAQVVNEDAALR